MNVPNTLKKLLEPYPEDIQLRFREAIEKLHLQNPDDPIFELMLVLGLWGTYYQKIPEQIVQASQQIAEKHDSALRAFDERIRMLQGLAQLIQQSTDRLSSASTEIVENFPVEEIVRKITTRLDRTFLRTIS